MTWLEILQDIGAIANDPDLTSLKSRAEYHFGKAFSDIVMSGEYTQNDVPGYFKLVTDVNFVTNPYNISNRIVLKIDKIFLDPTADNTSTSKFVSVKPIEDIIQMSSNNHMRPGKQDIFIYRVGDNLHAFTKDGTTTPASAGSRESTINLDQSGYDNFYMYYVEDFDYSAFEDSLELNSGTQRFLSFSFTRKCIGIAGAALIVEDAQ
tara:strand:- start:3349 stop:3969 length:621 start_codon:yes stop_codon:yes gene_type:complete